LVEESKQGMNFGAERMRDGTCIELVPVRAEESVDGFNYLAWEDLGHCAPWGVKVRRFR